VLLLGNKLVILKVKCSGTMPTEIFESMTDETVRKLEYCTSKENVLSFSVVRLVHNNKAVSCSY
jgi:hypothetical protein